MLYTLLVALLPLCQTEDSINCHWQAQAQGNGTGTSFAALGHRGLMATYVVYANGRRAYVADY